jgi:NitT/TauT family transport system substrate-binding protein
MTVVENEHRTSRPRRPRAALGVVAAALTLAACGGTGPGDEVTTVAVGSPASISNAPMYIGIERGYFREEGLDIQLQTFGSASQTIAPLGAGQLQVAAGSPSAGLYNAIARDVDLKIVADSSHSVEGAGYMALLVRKDLVDSGRFTSFADLRGLTVADYGDGGTPHAALSRMAQAGGVALTEITRTTLAGPDHVSALQNGSIDASISVEPIVTQAVDTGAAVRFAGTDAVDPGQQIGVLLYGNDFVVRDPDAAQRFMRAYLRGVRDYAAVLQDGRLTGPGAPEVIDIVSRGSGVPAETLGRIVSHGVDPDGRINDASLRADYEFWKSQGLIQGDLDVATAIDTSFAENAARELGAATTG